MDLSSEFVHALLPLYLATGLGASMLAIGLIEGTAEAIALVVKVFSGVLSDAVGRRKPLVLAGYGLAALTKPVFALAPSLGWIVAARFADRVGKGIRGAPRDALIADITPPEVRGASFGLRKALVSPKLELVHAGAERVGGRVGDHTWKVTQGLENTGLLPAHVSMRPLRELRTS